MAVLDAKKTYKNLLKKGFDDAQHKSADHKWLELFYDGKLILHTKVSHGENDLGNFLIRQMSYQCKLSKDEFTDLVNCPMSKKQYFDILQKNGFIE